MSTRLGKKTKEALKGRFFPAKTRVKLSPADMLKILREKNELTQAELAKRTKLTQATISSLESGRVKLGVERAKVLARALHVHPAVLVFAGWDIENESAA
jgi:transcriptional regulator with XRE-family HTH domain